MDQHFQNANMEEKTITQNNIFNGKLFNLHVDKVLLPNQKYITREFVEHKGASCTLAITPKNEILFVKQFRYPFKKVLLELPTGKLEGNSPLECAKKELLEETGGIGENFIPLGNLYPTVAYSTEVVHLFTCRINDFKQPSPDENEFLKILKIPVNKAIAMVMNNQIPDAKTQIAILKYKEFYGKDL